MGLLPRPAEAEAGQAGLQASCVLSSRGRSAGAAAALSRMLPVAALFSKQKGCCGGFSPHFVGSSLFSPTVYYTADGLTRNSFLRACVREQNCSNECMFDCFINF